MQSEGETKDLIKTMNDKHYKGIRTKCLNKLMKIDSILKDDYDKLKNKTGNYQEYIQDFDRINDIARILKCSERTARDYRDTLIYFSI